MKTHLRLVLSIVAAMGLFMTLSAQTWSDYILEDKGDTVVVKPTSATFSEINTIFHAIMGDTTATGERTNPNRVYETVRGGYYLYDSPATIDATVPFVKIVAPAGTDQPPLHLKLQQPEGGLDKAFFRLTCDDFYMENQYICQALEDNTLDRNFFRSLPNDGRYEFKHCYFELSNWAFLSDFATGSVFKLTDCLIQNVGREANLEKGNILDGTGPEDTIWFENNTFLNFGNLVIVRPNGGPRFAYFNHNTIVNSTNNPFYFFSQPEMIVTNNLIINTGVVPDYPDFYPFYQDEDKLPKGIVNVDTMEAAWITDYFQGEYKYPDNADRKILVDMNDAWWDSRFQDMFDNQLAPFPDTIDKQWASQMITMNSRAQAMFDDDDSYPYFVEGTWYNKEPDFANNKDMVPEMVSFIVTNAIPGDPNGGDPQPIWRTNMVTNLQMIDWPPLPDLSYTDADLYTGGVNNYPLGDLNWFPGKKASWMTTGEPAKLIEAMMAGQVVEDWAPVGINNKPYEALTSSLETYPNPITDMATIRFDLAGSSNVQLVVYNVIGEQVMSRDLGYYSSGIHEVTFEKGDLKSGMYILQLNTAGDDSGLTAKISIK